VYQTSGAASSRIYDIQARLNERMQQLTNRTGINFSRIFAQATAAGSEVPEVSDGTEAAGTANTSNTTPIPTPTPSPAPTPSPNPDISPSPDTEVDVPDVPIPEQTPGPATPSGHIWSTGREHYVDLIAEIAARYDLDPLLIEAVIEAESSFNPYDVSSAGASGLMQLMPATAAGLGVTDVFDPEQNIDGGVRYLLGQIIRFDGDVLMALAAYNCGPNGLKKRGVSNLDDPDQWDLLPRGTQIYLNNIRRILEAEGRGDLLFKQIESNE